MGQLLQSLNSPDHREESARIVRSLVDRIEMTPNDLGDELVVDLMGDLAGILQIASTGELRLHPKTQTAPLGGGLKVVAGTRNSLENTGGVSLSRDPTNNASGCGSRI